MRKLNSEAKAFLSDKYLVNGRARFQILTLKCWAPTVCRGAVRPGGLDPCSLLSRAIGSWLTRGDRPRGPTNMKRQQGIFLGLQHILPPRTFP